VQILVITGLSGAGKGTALKALEDIGFFCVDNLPFVLLPKFVELSESSLEEVSRVAIMIDVRSRDLKEKHFSDLKSLTQKGHQVEIIFMEAADDVIERRFKTTRRKHPWKGNVSIQEAIALEKKLFLPLRKFADHTIDTSGIHVHELRQMIEKKFSMGNKNSDEMQVVLISFGYSHGLPGHADLVMDVRFLPNPFFIEELKEETGESPRVMDYLYSQTPTREFLEKFEGLLDYLLPLYKAEGKAYLTIAVGCTGGRHRSVMIVNHLKKHLSKKNIETKIKHRDMEK